jgi:hypothetical protein
MPAVIKQEALLLTYTHQFDPTEANPSPGGFQMTVKFLRNPDGWYDKLTLQMYGNQAPELTFNGGELSQMVSWLIAVTNRFNSQPQFTPHELPLQIPDASPEEPK